MKRPPLDPNEETIECRLCGRPYRAVTGSHLAGRHGLDPAHPVQEYKRRFRLLVAKSGLTRSIARRNIVAWHERRGRHWSRERLLTTLERLGRRLRPLSLRRFYKLGIHQGGLPAAARRDFGSWRAAVLAAGATAAPAHTHWTRSGIVAALRELGRERHLRQGADLPKGFGSLYPYAIREFGSWREALRRAHVPGPGPYRFWSRTRVLREIRRLGRTIRPLTQQRLPAGYSTLAWAAAKYCGSWAKALAAAGVQGWPTGIRWSSEKILRTIRGLHAHRKPLGEGRLPPRLRGLPNAARRRWGSWPRAVQAALGTPKKRHLDRTRKPAVPTPAARRRPGRLAGR